MTILMWDKPKKKISSKDWKDSYSFEDGPSGGYVPNMSADDARAWKAKITGTKLGYPQVEIRKSAGAGQMLIIINLGDGYNYKHAKPVSSAIKPIYRMVDNQNTAGKCLHISMNGPCALTFEEMSQLPLVIEEAKSALNEIVETPGERKFLGILVYGEFDISSLDHIGKIVLDEIDTHRIVTLTVPVSKIPELESLEGVRRVTSASEISEIVRDIFDKDYMVENVREEMAREITRLDKVRQIGS